jgi:adenine-specific DNA methylase
MPINIWFRDGQEVHRRTLTEVTGASDGQDYLAMGCDAWVIRCPECGRIYAAGQTWPSD